MSALILSILKIILISLLVILSIIILLLLIVLFVPIKYKSQGTYNDGTAHIEAKITWFLHSVSAFIVYESKNPFHIYVKVFGIAVFDNLRPAKEKNRNKKVKNTKTKTKENKEQNELQAAAISEKITTDTPSYETSDVKMPEDDIRILSENDDVFLQKCNIFQKIKLFFTKFVDFFKNIKFTCRKIYDTIIKIKDNIKYYFELLQLESTKQAFADCKKQLKRILNKLAPKKYMIYAHLGFDDPAVMGNVLAVWGMLYPLHNGNIDIQPEFETTVAEGSFYLKGRISIYIFVQALYMFMFDKNIKLLVKRLKRSI